VCTLNSKFKSTFVKNNFMVMSSDHCVGQHALDQTEAFKPERLNGFESRTSIRTVGHLFKSVALKCKFRTTVYAIYATSYAGKIGVCQCLFEHDAEPTAGTTTAVPLGT
jgi:hypothetical protein